MSHIAETKRKFRKKYKSHKQRFEFMAAVMRLSSVALGFDWDEFLTNEWIRKHGAFNLIEGVNAEYDDLSIIDEVFKYRKEA